MLRSRRLNALFLDPGVSGGTETYLRGLVPALAAERPGHALSVADDAPRRARAARAAGWRRGRASSPLPRDEGQRLRRPGRRAGRAARASRARRGADVAALARQHRAAGVARSPHVVTVHDVTFFRTRTCRRRATFAMRQSWPPAAAQRADGLIAISAAARDEIARDARPLARGALHRRAPRRRRRAGRPPRRTGASVRARLRAADGARVVLCVAAKRPHKNQELLAARAARSCRRRRRRSCSPGTRSPTTRGCARSPATLGVAGARALRRLRGRRRARGAVAARGVRARSRRAPRGSACRSSRRCARGVPVAVLGPRRCCARSAATSPRYFDPARPGRGGRGDRRARSATATRGRARPARAAARSRGTRGRAGDARGLRARAGVRR